MAGGRFSVEAIFKAVDRMTAPVRRMQDRVRRFTESSERGLRRINETTSAVSERFHGVGIAAAAGAGIASAALLDVIRVGSDFEKTLMSATARFPGNIRRGTQAFEELREAAERVGATTEFDAQQAAGALNVFAAAGFNAQQAIAALPGAGDLATVAALGLDEAASLAADSLGALGLKTADAAQLGRNLTRVNDIMAKSTQLANTSATEFAEAIKAGGNAAVSSGASVETFGSMVSALAASNIKGAEAGTAIRNVFLRLQAPASKASRVLRQLHVNVRDSNGNMRDMFDILGELQTAMAGMGTAEKTEALSHLFGAETITPALALLNQGADGLRNMRAQLEGANGAAAAMATTMRDTTAGDIDGFTSAIDGVKTALFGVISGPFRGILVSLTEWTNKNKELVTGGLSELLTWCQQSHPVLEGIGKVILALATGFYTVSTALRIAQGAMALFNAVAAMNPFVLLAMGIAAAIAAIVIFWPQISGFFKRLWNGAKELGARIGAWFSSLWDGVTSFVSSAASAVGSALSAVWEPVKRFLVAAFEFYVGALTMVWGPILQRMRPVFDLFVAAAGWIVSKWGPVKEFLLELWTSVKNRALEAWEWIKSAATTVATVISDAFSAAWNRIVEVAGSVLERVKEIWAPISEFFTMLWNGISETFSNIFGAIVEKVGSVVEAVRSVGRETLGEGEASAGGSGPQVVSPQERTARSISETTNTTRGEVTIRDETGRAQMTQRPSGNTAAIQLQRTGAF